MVNRKKHLVETLSRDRKESRMDIELLLIDFILKASVGILLVLVIALVLGGCVRNSAHVNEQTGKPQNTSEVGSSRGTWNQTPQGGSDEKSNSAPVESSR